MDFNLSTDNYHDEVKKYEHEIISCSLQSFANDLASEQTHMIHIHVDVFQFSLVILWTLLQR